MLHPSRRTFLQTAVAAVASFFLPRGLRAAESSRAFWFLHTPTGEAFLYGERLAEEFPLRVYLEKWRRRAIEEPDDGHAAPCSGSNYCWEGVEQRWIPWRVLKSAWRHEDAPPCQNCDRPRLLTAF